MGKADSLGELKLVAWRENGRQRSSFPGAKSRRHSSKPVSTPTLPTQESQVCLGNSAIRSKWSPREDKESLSWHKGSHLKGEIDTVL